MLFKSRETGLLSSKISKWHNKHPINVKSMGNNISKIKDFLSRIVSKKRLNDISFNSFLNLEKDV
jgi:hypothetical protein